MRGATFFVAPTEPLTSCVLGHPLDRVGDPINVEVLPVVHGALLPPEVERHGCDEVRRCAADAVLLLARRRAVPRVAGLVAQSLPPAVEPATGGVRVVALSHRLPDAAAASP